MSGWWCGQFGPNNFWPIQPICVVLCCGWCWCELLLMLVCVLLCVGCCLLFVVVVVVRFGPRCAGPRSPGPFPVDPFRGTPPPQDRPKFRVFFSFLPPQFSFFLPGPSIGSFGLSGCLVKPRRVRGRRSFTPENSKRVQNRARRNKHHQNSTKGPRERKKERKLCEMFSQFFGPPFGAPHFRPTHQKRPIDPKPEHGGSA